MKQIFSLKTRVISTLVVVAIYLGLLWFYTSRELGPLADFHFEVSWYLGAGIGGVFALFAAFKFGINSAIGKFLIFSGLGLLASMFGTMIWDYQIYILGVEETPYPSGADFSYILLTPLVGIGLFFLLKAYRVSIKKSAVFMGVILAVILMVIFSIVNGAEMYTELGSSDVALFNLLYNINDSITLPIALVTLFMAGGKLFKGYSIFAFGFLLQAVANLTFGYRNFNEIYYQGDYGDLLFILSSVVMSIGVIVIANQMSSRNSNVQ